MSAVSSVKSVETHKGSSAVAEISTSVAKIGNVALGIFSEYPANAKVTQLASTFEIKRAWLYSEWNQKCQFSKYIQPHFPNRSELEASNKNLNVEKISQVFHEVRGKFALWQEPKESGQWEKVEVANLSPEWVEKNVVVLYPSNDRFTVDRLDGLVLWEDASKGKIYQLIEGNHRISTWLATKKPLTIPATIFMGKPKAKA